MVEALLVDLLEVFLGTLGSNHIDGLGDVEAIRGGSRGPPSTRSS